MNISVRQFPGARIVDLEGDVDLGTSPNLRRALLDLLGEAPKLALNMRALRYIDSSGIATLIEVFKDSQRLNKRLVLFGLSPAVREAFHLTHVHRIFQIFETDEEAVTSA
jgi:anti-sigma B factor antagonist